MPPTLVTFSSSLGYLSLNGYFSYETKSCKQIDPFSFNVMHLKFWKGTKQDYKILQAHSLQMMHLVVCVKLYI